MIDFIPLPIYTGLFDYLIFFLFLLAVAQASSNSIFKPSVIRFNSLCGYVILAILVFYMGLRPISGLYFGDTANYAASYSLAQGEIGNYAFFSEGEWVFALIKNFFAWNGFSVHTWFLFLSFLYFYFNYLACRKLFSGHYYLPMLVTMSMFAFWAYGVNGIRVGLALSMVLVAIAYYRHVLLAGMLCFLAFYIHKSVALVIFSAFMAYWIKNPKIYFRAWFASIGLSLVLGNAATNLMLSLGFADERFNSYLSGMDEYSSQFSSTGFRFDFLLYSALPMAYGYYFIFKRKYQDKFYIWLLGTYVFANCFWIMVIRAAFSNRFAMLSWTIMPILLIYPFMQQLSPLDKTKRLAISLCIFYGLTFIFNIFIPLIKIVL